MKQVYPIILTPAKEGGYVVSVPDLDINTQGDNLAEALDMARDAINLWICSEQDTGRNIPKASDITAITTKPNEIKTLVDVDTEAYRRAMDNRTVRKNLTIPSWLNDQAEKTGVNFSQILQEGLKNHLGIKNKSVVKQP